MSRKHVVSKNILQDADITSVTESDTLNTKQLDYASIHISWSGASPVGEIIVKAKNGENGSFYTVDMGGTIVISGNTGEHTLVFNQIHFSDLKLEYVQTSGTGTITASATLKSTGA